MSQRLLNIELTVGEAVRVLRLRKGWTQARLARAAFISEGWLAAIESGKVQPRAEVVRCLEAALTADAGEGGGEAGGKDRP